jgi:4a-hydroxytetrahydrobiopterin dehydratase
MSLSQQQCEPCRGGIPPLTPTETAPLLAELGKDWVIEDNHHLLKSFTFPNFVEALAFTNQVGNLAEEVAHHPDILLSWGKVEIRIWTHKIDGLNKADFILAAKIEDL